MQRPASTGSRKLEDHLVSLAFVRDPYPALAHLRETDPVHWSDSIGGWLLTCYDDANRDPDQFAEPDRHDDG